MVVFRGDLHVLRSTLHVHNNIRYAKAGNGGEHLVVHLPGRNVVDESHAIFFHAHLRYIGTESVY